jgi:hypothetical protein
MPVNAARLAELHRKRAALEAELAEVDEAIANAFDDQGPPPATSPQRRPPVRQPYKPPPREVSPIAHATAGRQLKKMGITP